MARLVLVRHAESVWQEEQRYSGSSEVGLSTRGREQAELLGRWAKGASIDAMWSSPQRRTLDTAVEVTRATGMEPIVDERLRELDFGAGEGHTLEELEQDFPDDVDAFRSAPVDHHLPRGEDPRAAARRVVECLQEIAQLHPQDRVLVVLHSTVMRLALCHFLGLPLNDYRRVFPLVRNCGLTEILLSGDQASLLQFNTPIHVATEANNHS